MNAHPLLRLTIIFSLLSGCAPEEDASPGSRCDDGAPCADVAAQVTRASYQHFSLETGTPLPPLQPTDRFKFLVAANRDVFAIKQQRTGTGSTEVHVLSAASNYQRFVLETGTPLPETPSDFEFDLTANRDLVAFKTQNTSSGQVEVHILSAASGYRTFGLRTPIPLIPLPFGDPRTYHFKIGRNDDIVVIMTSWEGDEVYTLSAASSYQTFSTYVTKVQVNDAATFLVDRNTNDIFAIKPSFDRPNEKPGPVTGVELSAANRYAVRAAISTPLKEWASRLDFALAPNLDLIAFKKSATGTSSVEVHVLAR